MTNEVLENLNKLGKVSLDAIKELYEINSKTVEQITEQQLAYANLYVETTTRQMKLATEAKGYNEVVNGQTKLVDDISKKAQGIALNTVDIINESNNEVSTWVEKGVQEASTVVPFENKVA